MSATAPRSTWALRWAALAPREQRLIALAAMLSSAALLWWLALAPALRTLTGAAEQAAALDLQLQQVRSQQQRALTLQAQPRLRLNDARHALEATVRQRLGSTAQLSLNGERATLTLKGVDPTALADWLTLARVNARSVAIEAHLQRNPAGNAWDGTLVLALPGS
jgi:general secretion pathway protein M